MITIYLYAIASVVAVSLASLVGAFTLAINAERLKKAVFLLVALAAGALFGDVALHLLPEIFEEAMNPTTLSVAILAGILVFFILEKFLHWHHHHAIDVSVEESDHHAQVHPVGHLNLISDGLHNFIDGVIIGISFLASPALGFATTLAVILHEIPQEIGDFGILLHAGFTKKKALLFNLLSAALAIIGTILALLLSSKIEGLIPVLLAFTAGGFLYIAGSDLVPELHKTTDPRRSLAQFLALVLGILLMFGLLWLE